ncbi:MAG: LacI family transcriptional regulator [Acidimicrobiia bacterium]|nr:LacI family transcriptional regulator [Acidimicrobiia bacterium]MYF83961.1 LacI family transcriptional regulator [Acidimicrobiia bacterium]
MKPPTIFDVAQEAGVSVSTVSRHLRGDRVRAAERISRAVAQLRYRPSPAAQSLKSGKTGAVALVVPDITNPFFAAVVRGAESITAQGGHTIFLANTDESDTREAEVVEDLLTRVDGMLLAPASEDNPSPQRLADAGVPTVLIDREAPSTGRFDTVLIDNHGGARSAVEHLLSNGHERIATIAGTVDSTPGRFRLEGYRAALDAHSIELPPEFVQPGGFKEHGGYQSMLRLLALPDPPTAVFVANNTMTIGALRAIKDIGVRIPDDLSVVGFDDHPFSEILDPPLTVIDRPMEEQGALAMRMLLSRMRNDSSRESRRVVLDVRLIERASCGPPRSAPMGARRQAARI